MPQPSHRTDLTRIRHLMSTGDLAQALPQLDAVLASDNTHAEAWHLKGILANRLNQPQAAITCFIQAMQAAPDFALACLDLAHTLLGSGQADAALGTYQHCLLISLSAGAPPAHLPTPAQLAKAEEWRQKGNQAQHTGQYAVAADCFRQVLLLLPGHADVLTCLGIAQLSMQQLSEAESSLIMALRAQPQHATALNVLGAVYKDMGQAMRAIAIWRHGLSFHPTHPDLLTNLGKTLGIVERHAEAAQACETLLSLRPDNFDVRMTLLHMHHLLCRFDSAEQVRSGISNAIPEGARTEPFFTVVHAPALHPENVRRYTKALYPQRKAWQASPLPADARGDGKLRIGYLSADFHQHATAHLISGMFEQHDRSHFDIYAYSYGPDTHDAQQQRIEQAVDHFRRVSQQTDAGIAQQIAQDGIDILVDLKGYTTGARLGMLASRPAPVQVHYLGFPATTACEFIDYFITDAVASPPGSERQFDEKLIRLPHSYQINDRSRPLPAQPPSRQSLGLPPQGLVLCAFNSPYKITADIFALWMRLLKATEGSVLWLYGSQGQASQNLLDQAQRHGVDAARIVTASHMPLDQHINRYAHADLFLDTHPVCGHTTASDALWAGVPVVTLAGEFFVSRVAASLLHAAGLPELVAGSLESYEDVALSLLRAPEKLKAMRQRLESQRLSCPLFDSAATTRALEAFFRHAASRQRARLAPAHGRLSEDLTIAWDDGFTP